MAGLAIQTPSKASWFNTDHVKLFRIGAMETRLIASATQSWEQNECRGPRIIATDRQAPRVYPRMIPLCSRFDSVLFTPTMSAIASYGNFSRSTVLISTNAGSNWWHAYITAANVF